MQYVKLHTDPEANCLSACRTCDRQRPEQGETWTCTNPAATEPVLIAIGLKKQKLPPPSHVVCRGNKTRHISSYLEQHLEDITSALTRSCPACLITLVPLSDGRGIPLLHICPLNWLDSHRSLSSLSPPPTHPGSLISLLSFSEPALRSKSPQPVKPPSSSAITVAGDGGGGVCVCVRVRERGRAKKGLSALTCRKDVKSVITLRDNR